MPCIVSCFCGRHGSSATPCLTYKPALTATPRRCATAVTFHIFVYSPQPPPIPSRRSPARPPMPTHNTTFLTRSCRLFDVASPRCCGPRSPEAPQCDRSGVGRIPNEMGYCDCCSMPAGPGSGGHVEHIADLIPGLPTHISRWTLGRVKQRGATMQYLGDFHCFWSPCYVAEDSFTG